MLQRIGDVLHRHKWLSGVLLGGIAVVFISWGAYGIVSLNFGGSNYAAEANGTKISLEQARQAWLQEQVRWQKQLGGADIPAELRAGLQNQVLEGLIMDALITERTHDLGYRVSHDELIDAVKREPAFQVSGAYSPEVAQIVLAQHNVTLPAYEADLRTGLQRQQLEGGIRASGFLTPTEIARLGDLEDQEREVRYLVLPVSQFAAAVKIDDATIAAYYKSHQTQYMTPESVALEYAQLLLTTLEAQQAVSEEDLRAAYEKNQSRLAVPERRHARHILLTGKDDAAALAQAQQVLAQAQAGKDFSELARQYSQDPGSAQKGGDLGWAERKSFVAPFADALFSMSVGEIRGPVKTQFGYHIIRLDEIQAAKGKSFEEARPELDAQIRRDRATDRFGEIQEQLQSKLGDSGGADLAGLAKEYGLEHGDIANFLKGPGGAPLGPAPQLQDLLFGESPLPTGRIGGPLLLGDDRLLIVKVHERRKPVPRPMGEVREAILAALIQEQGTQEALKAAQAALGKLEGGASFDGVAQELKVTVGPAHFVGREDPSIPAPVRAAVFSAPRPAGKPVFRALALNDGGAALIEVSQVRTAAVRERQARSDRALEEALRVGTADARGYVEEVRRTADVRKNPKAFE